MLRLYFLIVVIVASLEATGVEAQGGCTVPTSEWLSDTIKYTFDDLDSAVEIKEIKILCNSYDYGKQTVLCLYSQCNETSCTSETESIILDVTCADGIKELTHYETISSDAYYTISTDNTNCSDCLDVDLFRSRNYPTNPSDSLAYNETTHCLCKYGCNLLLSVNTSSCITVCMCYAIFSQFLIVMENYGLGCTTRYALMWGWHGSNLT